MSTKRISVVMPFATGVYLFINLFIFRMNHKMLFYCLLSFVFSTVLSAQISPQATLNIRGEGKAISIHGFSGIPIIQTNETYTGVHPVSYEKIWEIDRSKGNAAIESVGGEAPIDYVDIGSTPFAYLSGSIINVLTGQVLVDATKEDIKRFFNYYIIPEADLILFELGAKGKVKLYGVNPFESALKWGVDLREVSGLGQTLSSSDGSSQSSGIAPLLTNNGDLLYHNGKYLASVDLKSGKLKWNNKLDPGYIFLNNDASRILVAERRGGLGGAMSFGPTKFGKALYLLDANSGESLWSKGDSKMGGNIQFIMPYESDYIVVHDEGLNIYSYEPGKAAEGRWKKDYSEKGIKDIVVETEGLMVYFKNRRMLVDPTTGDDVWKKAEKLEREPPAYVMARQSYEQQVGDASYYMRGNTIYVKINNKTTSYRCDAYTVNEARNQLVITRVDDPDANYVGAIGMDAIAIDLSSGKVSNGSYSIRKGAQGVDATADGYFFYNDRSYCLMNFDGSKWTEAGKEYYPDPSRGERFLKGLVMYTALAGADLRNQTNTIVSGPDAADAYSARSEAIGAGTDMADQITARQKIGQIQQEFAYFFARNDDNKLVLFKVEKASGKEVKEYPFDDTKPVYEVDNLNDQLYYLVGEELKIFAL